MLAELQCVVLDCPDPIRLARFYRSLLGGVVNQRDERWAVDDDWAKLHLPSGQVFAFQWAADHRPPQWPDPSRPQQIHPDFAVPDLDRAQEQVLAWGATVLEEGPEGRSWRVCSDPAGHPFCLVRH